MIAAIWPLVTTIPDAGASITAKATSSLPDAVTAANIDWANGRCIAGTVNVTHETFAGNRATDASGVWSVFDRPTRSPAIAVRSGLVAGPGGETDIVFVAEHGPFYPD